MCTWFPVRPGSYLPGLEFRETRQVTAAKFVASRGRFGIHWMPCEFEADLHSPLLALSQSCLPSTATCWSQLHGGAP